MLNMRNHWLRLGFALAAAVLVGVIAAAAGLKLPGVAAAAAANHCTRYAPVISQDYNCTVTGTMYSSGSYQTPSTALRDSNYIGLNASRTWTLCYVGGSCSSGVGTVGSMGASSGYKAAWCAIAGSAVTGRCTTYWHD